MTCISCGQPNPETNRFCGGCGRPLAAGSPPERAPRLYTPRHLADKILTSRAALEGERKQVTVLFADVKGSMELAEQLDPEAWHGIMDRFFQLLAEGVHRFEGTVNQYTGDGIMALFGAPIAHEDHAQRACWTALHLREALRRYADELRLTKGLSFSVRMGLNSGEVVVGRIGDDLRMDYTAQGHTVGLAQRMEQLAAPDSAYLTEHTARLVAGYFRLRDLGPLAVKGAREPVRVHELEGVGALRTRLDVSRSRGFTRFVGRADEMGTLEGALDRALQGEGQVVGVVAEAGVGKSRLCYEFSEGCRARGLQVLEAHALAHGRSVPLLPILELFRAFFGITVRDPSRTAREKIAGRLLLLDESLRDALALTFDFMGVADPEHTAPPLDPETRQRQVFDLLHRVIQASSRREPLVTLIEDLHWLDDTSALFLEQLVSAGSAARSLLLVTFRPEYRAAWTERSHYRQVPLRPLGPEASRQLMEELLGSDSSVAALREAVHERTGGNPFFIEEVVQSLVEGGSLMGARGAYRLVTPIDRLAVPETVQAVLAARIDRLAEPDKHVLQTAAVIGRCFSQELLRAVAGSTDAALAESLQALEARELITTEALHPEAEYAFRHPLTQEVAYRTQLGERRARVHAAVAHALAELVPEKREERAGLIAHHWESAGEAMQAARWHHRAARWIRDRDLAEAMRHWRRARELLSAVPESEDTMRLGLAVRRHTLAQSFFVSVPDEEARALFEEGTALAARRDDRRSLALLHWGYAESRRAKGWVAEYRERFREVVRLVEEVGDDELRYAVGAGAVLVNLASGDLREAHRLATELLDRPPPGVHYGRRFAGGSSLVIVTHKLGVTLIEQGRLDEGESRFQQGLRLSAEAGDPRLTASARAHLVQLLLHRGDARGVMDAARLALEAAESAAGEDHVALARFVVAWAHLAREEWQQAASALEAALGFSREHGVLLEVEAEHLAKLAEAHLGRGDPRGALETAEGALEIGRSRGQQLGELDAQIVRARALVRLGSPAGADAALAAAEALVERTGAGSRAPLLHLARAELAAARGDPATRQRELREAHRRLVAMGALPRAEKVAQEIGL